LHFPNSVYQENIISEGVYPIVKANFSALPDGRLRGGSPNRMSRWHEPIDSAKFKLYMTKKPNVHFETLISRLQESFTIGVLNTGKPA